MIRINLLPVKELKAEVARRRELSIAGISLALTLAFVLGIYLFQSYRISDLENNLADLRKELQTLNAKAKEVVELQSRIKEFQSKSNVIEDIKKKKVGPVRVMESLSAATPSALWLTEFRETGGNLTISGVAVDNQTIAEFLKSLASSPYFGNPELVETTQTEQTGMPPRKFVVRSRLSYQAPPAAAPGNGKATAPPVPKGNPG